MSAVFQLAQESFAALLALLAVAGCGFAVASGILLEGYGELSLPLAGRRDRRWSRRFRTLARAPGPRDADDDPAPAVALLKPLHGSEPALAANLKGYVGQDYPGPSIVWLGVQSEADAALPAARALAAAHADRVRLVLDPRHRAGNGKVGNLMNLEEAASAPEAPAAAEVIVVTDSDIGVPPGWLTAVVEALARPDVGLVSCLYSGVAVRRGLAARMGAMGVSYGFLPQGAAGVAIGARPAMGSTLALTRETLEAVGGFAAVKDVLADDYELGRAVRRLGLEVVSTPVLVSHDSAEAGLGELWRHELRWSTTIRSLDPSGYAGSLVTHFAPLALFAVLLSNFNPLAVAVLAISILARLWLKGRVDAVVGRVTGPWWLLPARDMLSLAVFTAAWFARRVDWKGSRFHVGRDGELTPV